MWNENGLMNEGIAKIKYLTWNIKIVSKPHSIERDPAN